MIEIEKRGLLKTNKKLLNFLTNSQGSVDTFKQLNIFIESDHKFLGDLSDALVSINISIKSNKNTTCRVKFKYGNIQSDNRIEKSFKLSIKEIQSFYSFLKIFKIDKGAPRFYNRTDYTISSFKISIKKAGLIPDHFEIETNPLADESPADALRRLENFAKKFDVEFFSKSEYKDLMTKTRKQHPPIPFEEIDLGLVL